LQMVVRVKGTWGFNGCNLDMWLTVPLIPRQSAGRLAPNQSDVLLTSFALNPVLQPGTCCPSYRPQSLAMDIVSSSINNLWRPLKAKATQRTYFRTI
jgi:hypothetical protein